MRKLYALSVGLVLSLAVYGAANYTRIQNGLIVKEEASIGSNTTPDSDAVLDIVSTTKGVLLPRMTTTQRDAISTPTTGLQVFNTTTGRTDYYNGSAWLEHASLSGTETLTNKTIDGDLNTIQDLGVTTLKTVAGNADKVLIFAPTTGAPTAVKLKDENVDSEAATSGYVLTADGAGNAAWNASSSASTDQSYELTNLSISCTVAANALTCALKDKAGSDPSGGSPVRIGFRSSTLTTGTYVQRSVTSALSMTISSGSTLGMASGVADYVYVYLIDNAGTVEMALSSATIDEGRTINTTAEGGAGAADAWGELYTATGRTGVAVRMVGRIRISEATAGTWATNPTEVAVKPFDGVKLITTSLQTEDSAFRIEHAQINCDGSSGVIGNTTQTWIASVDNITGGACLVNLRANMFDTNPPSCFVTDLTGASSDPLVVGIQSYSGSAVNVDCSTNSGTDCTAYDFSIVCMGPAKTN